MKTLNGRVSVEASPKKQKGERGKRKWPHTPTTSEVVLSFEKRKKEKERERVRERVCCDVFISILF